MTYEEIETKVKAAQNNLNYLLYTAGKMGITAEVDTLTREGSDYVVKTEIRLTLKKVIY